MAEEAQVSEAPAEATEAVADPSAEAVDDANDLRAFHF